MRTTIITLQRALELVLSSYDILEDAGVGKIQTSNKIFRLL